MKRDPFRRLVEHARRVRDDAASRAATAERAVDGAQRTLDLLSGYLQDHLQRARSKQTTDAPSLGVRENFTRRLDLAIGEQARQRDDLRDAAQRGRVEFAEQHRRLIAFETVQARREATLLAKERRAEQKQTDDLAAQLARRRTGTNADGT